MKSVTYLGPHTAIDVPDLDRIGDNPVELGETVDVEDDELALDLASRHDWEPDGWELPTPDPSELSPQLQALIEGSIDDVLERVGVDEVTARAALQAEQASGKPRTGLVKSLTRLANYNKEG